MGYIHFNNSQYSVQKNPWIFFSLPCFPIILKNISCQKCIYLIKNDHQCIPPPQKNNNFRRKTLTFSKQNTLIWYFVREQLRRKCHTYLGRATQTLKLSWNVISSKINIRYLFCNLSRKIRIKTELFLSSLTI